jgi:quercetin dioxygenase-like cupin family protein
MMDGVPGRTEVADLSPLLRAEGDGVHWSLAEPGDLNVNLVRLGSNHGMSEHVNDAVDVVVIVLAGSGQLVVNGAGAQLRTAVVAQIPMGATRSIHADAHGLAYLTVHRRRNPLTVGTHP